MVNIKKTNFLLKYVHYFLYIYCIRFKESVSRYKFFTSSYKYLFINQDFLHTPALHFFHTTNSSSGSIFIIPYFSQAPSPIRDIIVVPLPIVLEKHTCNASRNSISRDATVDLHPPNDRKNHPSNQRSIQCIY